MFLPLAEMAGNHCAVELLQICIKARDWILFLYLSPACLPVSLSRDMCLERQAKASPFGFASSFHNLQFEHMPPKKRGRLVVEFLLENKPLPAMMVDNAEQPPIAADDNIELPRKKRRGYISTGGSAPDFPLCNVCKCKACLGKSPHLCCLLENKPLPPTMDDEAELVEPGC